MRGKSVGFHGWNSSPGPEKWSPTNFRPCASEIGLERLLKADKTSSEIEGHKSLIIWLLKIFLQHETKRAFCVTTWRLLKTHIHEGFGVIEQPHPLYYIQKVPLTVNWACK